MPRRAAPSSAPQRKVNDEYDVIMNNILMMFLNNTYLNIQLKEKQYRQQNAELTARSRAYENSLENVLSSSSWKLPLPLRRLVSLFHRGS